MIKTIKVKKQLRLDELIKYVWDNHLYPETFKSNFNDFAHFDKTGKYQLIEQKGINQAAKFTVEVEEEINERHKFEQLTTVFIKPNDDKARAGLLSRASVYDVLVGYGDSKIIKIYALVGTTLQLIWEAE